MDDEIQAIEKNNTWKLTDLRGNEKPIVVTWVYKKFKPNGERDILKA